MATTARERIVYANPAPRDRVLISGSFDGSRGPWCPVWRANTPGFGVAHNCVGSPYSKFIAFWRAVSEALYHWNRMGRPGPVFSHLTPGDQAFILAGGDAT